MEKSSALSNHAQHVKSVNGLAKGMHSPFFKPVIQTKLTVNQPGDEYEQEADAVADKVMIMSEPSTGHLFFKPTISHVQQKRNHFEEEEKKLQRKGSNGEAAVAPSAEGYIHSLSGGQSLNKSEKTFFETRMGYDFSEVQIHNDAKANESAANINALAYTHQNHIVFGEGQYRPGNDAEKKLLAHELTHVVQQQNKVPVQGLIQTQRRSRPSTTDILNREAYTTHAYTDAVQHWPDANSIWDVLTSVNAKINFLRFILSFDQTNCVRYDATDTNAGETCSATASAVTRFTNACQGYASQMYARYTSSGRLSATAEANLQSQANIVIGTVPAKFQMPIRIVSVPGHAFNAVLVDTNPADANSWAFFEPQNDRIFFATDSLLRSSVYAGSGIFSLSSLTDFTGTGQYVRSDDRNFLLNSSNQFINNAITPSQRITLNNLFRDIFIADDLSSHPYYTSRHSPPQTYEELIASHNADDITTLALAFNSSLSGRLFRRSPGGILEIMTRAIYLQLLHNPAGLGALIP